jgi:hypothetical protein
MRIAENNEFVMGKVTRFYDSIEESNFGLELCPNIFVFVVFAGSVALEGPVGENQVTIFAEGRESLNEFAVVKFVKSGENFPIILFGVTEQGKDCGAKQAA